MLPALLKEGRGLAALKDKPEKGESSQRQSFVQVSQREAYILMPAGVEARGLQHPGSALGEGNDSP